MTVPILNPNEGVSEEESVATMDAVIVPLVNFHARVMDYCVGAAQAIVKEKLVEQSAIVQGPDPGPAAGEHPMTGVMATAMYNQIIEDLRRAKDRMPVAAPGHAEDETEPDPFNPKPVRTTVAAGIDNPGGEQPDVSEDHP
jgi:hypothetical protein